jgi:hypothetical protein
MNQIIKKLFVVLGVLFLLVGVHLNSQYALAKSDEYQYDIEDENRKEDISYEDVKENMEEVIEGQENVKSEEQIVEVDFDIKGYDHEEAYTEYLLSDLPITKYAKCKSFTDLISSDCRVKVPYITNDNQQGVAVLRKGDNENYELQEEIILNDTKHIFVSPQKVDEIINSGITETVKEVKYTYSNRYFMTLVLVITEKNEYLIPFMSQEVDGIKNGNVYKVNDFFDFMNNTYDEEHIIENPKENGGVPYKVGDNSRFRIFGFVLAMIVFLFSLAGVVILKMKEVRNAI